MYKILVLKNGANIDVADECAKATQFFATRPNPIAVEFSFKTINIPIDWKLYKTVNGFNSTTGQPMLVDYMGLADSVKDNIRTTIVKEFECNAVMIVNDISNIQSVPGKSWPNWTNFKPLYYNTGYMQIVWNPYLKQSGEVATAIKHEPMHDFCYTLNRYGFPVLDEMDVDHLGRPYYRNDFAEDLDSNFGFTFANMKTYLDKLVPGAAPTPVLYKPANFTLKELVSPKTLAQFGDKAWEFLDERMLRNLQFIRESLGKPITVNKAGVFDNRCFDAIEERKNGYSQHNHGRAVDFDVAGMTAESVRQWIVANQTKFPEPDMWIEIGTNWVHIDVRYSDKKGVYLFNP